MRLNNPETELLIYIFLHERAFFRIRTSVKRKNGIVRSGTNMCEQKKSLNILNFQFSLKVEEVFENLTLF